MRAAFGLFTRRGYDRTSIDEIAVAAGVAKTSLYRHFAGKEDILAAGVQVPLRALTSVFADPDARSGPYVDRMAFVLRRVVEIEAEFLAATSVLVRLYGDTDTERQVIESRRRFERQVAELIERGVEGGELRSDIPPILQARLLLSLTSWIVVWFDVDGPMSPRALADHLVSFSLDGLSRRR